MFQADGNAKKWFRKHQLHRLQLSWKKVCYLVIVFLFISCGRWVLDHIVTAMSKEERVFRILREHPQFPLSGENLPDLNLKTILLWNTWFDWDSTFFFGTGRQPFIDAGCPESSCFVSNQRYLMPPSEYDAILFFFPMLTDVPFTYSRKPNQKYVFVNEEPPTLDTRVNLSHLNGFFNMTMTFRADSDIQWPYGFFESNQQGGPEQQVENYARGKTKLVAWFVSNCETESKREKYVENLKKYIQVDVYGKCGEYFCWAGEQEECYDMLEKDYKFYLSFENAFCRDYVTEKFFQLANRRIVPIVYGAGNYCSIAPNHSFIDATKMGAKKLAELLKTLDADDRLYNEYFQWKSNFKVTADRRSIANKAFCQLCQLLHSQPANNWQVYQNFDGWWNRENHCHSSGIFVTPFKTFSFYDINVTDFRPMTNERHLESTNSLQDL